MIEEAIALSDPGEFELYPLMFSLDKITVSSISTTKPVSLEAVTRDIESRKTILLERYLLVVYVRIVI